MGPYFKGASGKGEPAIRLYQKIFKVPDNIILFIFFICSFINSLFSFINRMMN